MEQLKIPHSWAEVTMSMFADVDDAQRAGRNDVDRFNRILSALSKTKLSEIESMKFVEVAAYGSQLNWIETMPKDIKREFEIAGRKFTLHTNPYTMSTGQFADLQFFLKKEGYYRFAECAAVLCYEGDQTKYDSDKVNERAEFFWNNLTIDIVFPYTSFFLKLYEKSLPLFRHSLRKKMKEIQQMNQEVLMETAELLSKSSTVHGNG